MIVGVRFDDGSAREEAPGSDNWPITWAENGNIYTSWGDGGGFGGTNQEGRVSLGIARVEGDREDYRGYNVAGGVDAPNPSPFPGKSEGILAIGNTLYLWRNGNGSGAHAFNFARLYRSDDLGASWSETGVEFSKAQGDFGENDEGFFSPTFCQFGRGYEDRRDDYVYMYAPEIIDRGHWDVQKPGRIALVRVPVTQIENEPAYEFFAGVDGSGAPTWTSNVAGRRPVWEDPAGTHRMAVSYNAGLDRYLLTSMTEDREGWFSLYAAPEPWGPWTLVLRERDETRWGSKVVTFTFVNKWLREGGTSFVIVHTKNDRWATIEGEFLVEPAAAAGH